MSFWNILEIEPTNDIKIIKSAYAKKAKEKHPEEYPEEFQELQAAYKAGLAYAKGNYVINNEMMRLKETKQEINKQEGSKEESDKQELRKTEKVEEPQVTVSYIFDELNEDILNDKDVKNCFWRELEYLLWHPYARQNATIWKCFLEQPQYMELFTDREFKETFIVRLCKENFYWNESEKTQLGCRYIAHFLNSFEQNQLKVLEDNIFNRIRNKSVFTLSECINKQERKIYDSIWRYDNVQNMNVEEYLSSYFNYAEDNETKLRKIHLEAHNEREHKSLIRAIIGLLLGIIFLGFRIVGFINSYFANS